MSKEKKSKSEGSLARLIELNPELANKSHYIAEEHDVIIAGEKRKDEEGNSAGLKFDLKTKPNEAAAAAGIKSNKYLRASFKRSGSVTASVENDGEESFRGSKKAQSSNVFKNTQTDMYNFLLNKLNAHTKENPTYELIGKTDDGLTLVRVKATVAGAVINLTVPRYKPQTRVDGKRSNLKATTYNEDTDKYEKNQDVILMNAKFFADLDDIDAIKSVAVRHYEKHVMKFEVGSKKTTETKGNETKTNVEEGELTEIEEDDKDE